MAYWHAYDEDCYDKTQRIRATTIYLTMKENLKLVEIRGTIFVPQIPFSWEMVKNLQLVLTDYLPSVNMSSTPMLTDRSPLNPTILAPGEWSLISPDKKQQVLFQAQKIDVLKVINEECSLDAITEFAKICQALFVIISKFTSQKCTRVAIAPNFEYVGEKDSIIAFANGVFRMNGFKDRKLENCDFSQVFRVSETILQKSIVLNYVSKFYAVNKVTPLNGTNQLVEVTMIDFDINSRVDPDVVFTQESIHEFFAQSPTFCEDFLSFYFPEQ